MFLIIYLTPSFPLEIHFFTQLSSENLVLLLFYNEKPYFSPGFFSTGKFTGVLYTALYILYYYILYYI